MPKKEDIAVTEQRVKEQDGEDFGPVQEDIQKQLYSQIGAGGRREI